MSIHIGAAKSEVSDVVIICGDPLRAQHIAKLMLSESFCYSNVRGMLGFSGEYKGRKVSVQGTGMGIPSTAIYLHELIREYGVKRVIRLGTCGAVRPDIDVGTLILATHAFTDSAVISNLKLPPDLPGHANEKLLHSALQIAAGTGVPVVTGPVFSTDLFYSDDESRLRDWNDRKILAVEMETSVLYALASLYNVDALTMLTVSDNLAKKVYYAAEAREKAGAAIMTLALDTLVDTPF